MNAAPGLPPLRHPSTARRHRAPRAVANQVLRIVGMLLAAVAVAMVPPALLALNEGLSGAWWSAIGVTGALGAGLWLATPALGSLDRRSGLLVTGIAWLVVALAGSLPFVFTGTTGLVPAIFESVSGFTATGATVFPQVESLPRSILLWRSLSHWLGGMGIIVLGVAILPFIGVGGAQLFYADAPGISTDRLTPRIASTARLLWGVYAGLTGASLVTYLLLGMPTFDAINHALSVSAAGGFSTRDGSLGDFAASVQWATVGFMLLSGTNFALHYRMVSGQWSAWVRDVEWRIYMAAAVLVTGACAWALAAAGDGVQVRTAAFNVVAVMTTSGFHTADFGAWPVVTHVLLLSVMFVGAMGGSTSGGFKVVRAAALGKHTLGSFKLVAHPAAVVVDRLGAKTVPPDLFLNLVGLFALYAGTHAAGTLILAGFGADLLTAASASLAAVSNVGPGLGAVGPGSHYGVLSAPSQVTLAALMLLGRLEFYAILLLLVPETWRGR